MWQNLRLTYQAYSNFWTPTEELRAVKALPFQERLKQLWRRSYWRASFRWPVIWRRVVALSSVGLVIKIMLFAVIGSEQVALEGQRLALLAPSSLSDDSLEKFEQAMKAQARADEALASYYCSIGVDPRYTELKFRCR